MARKEIPVTGIAVLIVIVVLVVYIAYTRIDNSTLRAIVILIPLIIAVSALMGLKQEYGIAERIVKEGLVDAYIEEHGLGNRETFDRFIRELEMRGYTVNPGTKAQLRREIVERYEGHKE